MDCPRLHREPTWEEKEAGDVAFIPAECPDDGLANDSPPPLLVPGEWSVIDGGRGVVDCEILMLVIVDWMMSFIG